MNRYKFIVAKPTEITEKEISNAKVLSNLDEILKVSKSIGEYVFSEDAELNKIMRTANSVSRVVETLKNGTDVNRAVVVLPNGNKFRMRIYGSKDLLPAKDYTKEEIAKLSFGFCTSDGEKITENRLNADTDEIVRVPVMYLKID